MEAPKSRVELLKKDTEGQLRKNKLITVFERDEILLNLLEYELGEKEGYTISSKSNASEFLNNDNNGTAKPDLIITDLVLEGYNGIEFINRLKETAGFSDTKIIVLSEKMSSQDIHQLRELNVDDIIQRPFKINELIYRVEKVFKDNDSFRHEDSS